MSFIVDIYKELETIDLIIFCGIIVMIILLFVFSMIVSNKSDNLKKLINKKNKKEITDCKYEELPIKKEKQHIESLTKDQTLEENQNEEQISVNLPEIPQIQINEKNDEKNIFETIETEKKFIAEEHVMEYNKELFSIPNIQKASKQIDKQLGIKQENNNTKKTKQIEMPTGPYQRNVLREMSLSQTSPIGLTPPKKKNDQNYEFAKDLEESLNTEQNEIYEDKNELKEETKLLIKKSHENTENYKKELNDSKNTQIIHKNNNNDKDTKINNDIKETNMPKTYKQQENTQENYNKDKLKTNIENKQFPQKEINQNSYNKQQTKQSKQIYSRENETIKKELSSIKNTSQRKTEIINNNQKENSSNVKNDLNNYKQQDQSIYEREKRETEIKNHRPDVVDPTVKELFNSVSSIEQPIKKNTESEKYLEEVSRKLAEADVSDGIDRTDYELEQEENAIISYKELMEKKDSIQTIDEEEAVISIEELMNRNNKQQELKEKEPKLYNLTDEEENDDFIKELKQFRNDL